MRRQRIIQVVVLILTGFAGLSSARAFNRPAMQSSVHSESASVVSSSGISSPVYYIPQSFDVLHYDVVLNALAAPSLSLGPSRCEIQFVWLSQPDTFRFHLRALHVDSVMYIEHHAASYDTLAASALAYGVPADSIYHFRVPATASQRVGDTVVCVVLYSGTMTAEPIVGGISWGGVAHDQSDAIYALGVGFHNNYVSCTQHWMPCYDLPSDKASLHVVIACPLGPIAGLSNGRQDTIVENDTSNLWSWSMPTPTATYLYTFAIGPYLETLYDTTSTGAPEILYAKKGDTLAGHITFKHLPDMVKTFEKLYGPYPNEKVGYVVTNNGSMEHQSLIALARAEIIRRDSLNEHVAHELSHQWFGDCVTPFDFRDAWLNESFATYSESAWMEAYKGHSAYIADQKSKASLFMADVGRPGGRYYEGILSIYDFARALPSSNYPQTIYLKGAVVLGMLRYMIGDSLFYTSLRDYLQKYRNANATYDSLVDCFLSHTPPTVKDSVRDYFLQWVKGKGWPQLQISCDKYREGSLWRAVLHCQQVQTDSLGIYTWFPLELSFRDASGTLVSKVVTITGATQEIRVDSLNDFTTILANSGSNVISLVGLSATPTITAVNSDEPAESMPVFPNPVQDLLHLRQSFSEPVRYSIFAIDGEQCLQEGMLNTRDSEHLIRVSNILSGSYILRLFHGTTMELYPFTIAR